MHTPSFRDCMMVWVMPTGDWVQDMGHLVGALVTITAAVFGTWKMLAALWARTAELRRLYTPKHQRWVEEHVARAISKIDVVMRINNNAVYVCTHTGENVMVTEALAELFGLTPEEMRGNGWSAAISSSADRARAVRHWHECVSNRIPYEDQYEICVRGQLLLIGTTAHMVMNSQNEVLFYTGWVWVIPRKVD